LTKIIDNSSDKLASVLCNEIKTLPEAAIASAYFNVHGFGALQEGIKEKPLRVLLGTEPTNSVKWEEEILKELEDQEDDPAYFQLLQQCIDYFKKQTTQVRIPVDGHFLHGKAYIAAHPNLQKVHHGIGSVGSSNFTRGGLLTNRELNMINTDREVVQELADWFNIQWDSAKDYKADFLNQLENYTTAHSPYEVIAKALYETFRENLEAPENIALKGLWYHQRLSYRDAKTKLETHGGVVIADSTGLGKSRTAISLAWDAKREGKKVLLIAPRSILDTTWKTEMEKTDINLRTMGSEEISRDPDSLEKQHPDADFIIVDEAHYFRNPATNRYKALRDLVIKNNAEIILCTATPVNNSLMDLYHLLALYLREDCIQDLCNDSLQGYFAAQQKRWLNDEPINMDDVLQRFVTRHSRALAKALDREGKIRFPDRILDPDPRNRYTTTVNYSRIDQTIDDMKQVYYDLSVDLIWGELKLPGGIRLTATAEQKQRESLKKLIKVLVKINLFKRLESSTAAFLRTISDLERYIKASKRYAEEEGYFFPPALKGDFYILASDLDDDEEAELPDPEDLFHREKYRKLMPRLKLSRDQIRDYSSSCERDLRMINVLRSLIPAKDAKLETFIDRATDIITKIQGTEKNGFIIFTQYAATADYIYEELRKRFPDIRLLLTTGLSCFNVDNARCNKVEAVEDFMAHGGVLVSTDVLSAGQNLQNAQFVANYDFPWNPVVLIQRIGRIDRAGSDHKQVYAINVLPRDGNPEDPSSLEFFLGLMTRIYQRLEAIRTTIGLDASTLGEEAIPKDFGIQRALADLDGTILDAMTRELEQFTASAMDTLANMMKEKGEDWLRKLPNGIGAYKSAPTPAMFVLFKDEANGVHYWRFKDLHAETTNTVATEIINTILEEPNDNKGDKINYSPLIDHMRRMKRELKEEIETGQKREKTIAGAPIRTTKAMREIVDALVKEPDGEELAQQFRQQANNSNLVRSLTRALREGNLVEKARELLKQIKTAEKPEPKPPKLKRICWCYLHPSH